MKCSHRGLALIKRFESLRTLAYQDTKGVWTLGFGHTHGVKKGDTCTAEQAAEWLAADVSWAEEAVNKAVTVPISQSMFDALVSFTFNLGAKRLRESTLLQELNGGAYFEVPGQFLRWYRTTGSEWGLLRRRAAEAALFLEDPKPEGR